MGRIDHWIETDLIQESDALEPLSFYSRKMREESAFCDYAKENG